MALRGSSLLSLSGDTRERVGRGLLGDGFTMDTPEYRAAAMLGAGNTVSGQVPQWFGGNVGNLGSDFYAQFGINPEDYWDKAAGNIDTAALQRAIEAKGLTYGEKKNPDDTFTGAYFKEGQQVGESRTAKPEQLTWAQFLSPIAMAVGANYLLPAAEAAMATEAPMSLAEAATQAIESGGLQAGTFGSGMESLSPGLLSGGGGYLTAGFAPAVGETLASAAADAIMQNGLKAGEFGSQAVQGTPLTASSPLTAANGAPGLLSTLQSGASAISQFAKDNPLLTKLGMTAAGGLLGGVGGTSSPTQYTGPAKQWSSPLQTGIVNPVQQVMPGAIQNNPNALAVQGNPYAGAWQYLRGG